MKKATFTGIIKKTPQYDGRVFLMSPLLDGHEFVYVSAANMDMEELNAMTYRSVFRKDLEQETLIFPCDPSGTISSFMDLGGYRGGLSHAQALLNEGYEIVEDEKVQA